MFLFPNISRAYQVDIADCGRPPNYFSTSALEWFCLYRSSLSNSSASELPCLTFAKCKTFGSCQPTDSGSSRNSDSNRDSNSDSNRDSENSLASAAVALHSQSQSLRGLSATPVLQFESWARSHVADDDALLPAQMLQRNLPE
jgi:hypothetical protein